MKLSLSEKAFLWRRRKGATQKDIARTYKLLIERVSWWEKGYRDVPQQIQKNSKNIKPVEEEVLIILRRRCSLSQLTAAKGVGLSKVTVNQLESGLIDTPQLYKRYKKYLENYEQ